MFILNYGNILPDVVLFFDKSENKWFITIENKVYVSWYKKPFNDPSFYMDKLEKENFWDYNDKLENGLNDFEFIPDSYFLDTILSNPEPIIQKAYDNGYNGLDHTLSVWLWQKIAETIEKNS